MLQQKASIVIVLLFMGSTLQIQGMSSTNSDILFGLIQDMVVGQVIVMVSLMMAW
jgi:hypothetical protein